MPCRCSTPPSPTATAASKRTPPRACSAPPRPPRCARSPVRASRRPAPPALEEVLKRVDEAAQRLRQGGGAAAPAPASTQGSLLGDDPRPMATRPFESSRPGGGRAESAPPRVSPPPVERAPAGERPAPALAPEAP